MVMTDTATKSGGYARFDIAGPLNEKEEEVTRTIAMGRCPDPEAYVEVSFKYERVWEEEEEREIDEMR